MSKTAIPYRPTTNRHPLHRVVVEVFKRDPQHGRIKLAVELSGCTSFRGPRAASGNMADRVVAGDVLGYMLGQGHLVRDQNGWYTLAEVTR